MDELDIKKPNKLFPKMFRTFTMYIFATLLVFFGYVQLFGDVKPNILQLPTDNTEAQENSYFGDFVDSIVNTKNIDADINIKFSYGDIALDVLGNVKYAQDGIAIDLSLGYNGQSINLVGNYANNCIYLNFNDKVYKFDLSALQNIVAEDSAAADEKDEGAEAESFDIKALVDFVCKTFNVDLSFIDDIQQLLGLDFENFNPEELLAKLEIKEFQLVDEKTEQVTGYKFNLSLGGTIQVFLECDPNFNIKSASTNNIKINDKDKNKMFVASVDAEVHVMNDINMKTGEKDIVEVAYIETGKELDLTGVVDYVDYGKNLFANRYVAADVDVKVGNQIYGVDVLIDTQDGFNLTTNISGLDVQLALKENVVYLCAGSLKFMFDASDYKLLEETLNNVLVEFTGKDVSDFVQEILNKINNSGSTDANDILTTIFGGYAAAMGYLPNAIEQDENSFALLWQDQNGKEVETLMNIRLENNNQVLSGAKAMFGDCGVDIKFAVAQNGFDAPENCYNLSFLLPKLQNLVSYINAGIYEFDFTVIYNEFNVVGQYTVDENGQESYVSGGTFKFNQKTGDIEVVLNDVCGQTLTMRVHDEVVYVAFGNMKIKSSVTGSGEQVTFADVLETINNLTTGSLGVKLDFGCFAEVFDILQNYKAEDYLSKLLINIWGGEDDLHITLNHKPQETLISQILAADFAFVSDKLNTIGLQIYDVAKAHLQVNHQESSTMQSFNEADYLCYSTNFMEGMLDSLQLQENVYAFSSDIAIRYSNNTFHGMLSAMFVKTQKEVEGILKEIYVPAISLYTTSLGLSSYIYLIDKTIYLDINGLQISADLNTTTINEVLDFVENNFGISLGGQTGALKGLNDLCVALPALDRIYGEWVSYLSDGQKINGVQVAFGNTVSRDDIVTVREIVNEETNESKFEDVYSNDVADYGGESNVLKYAENSWFYNIVLQAYIDNLNNTIVPNRVVLGANIHDPNTTLYKDYSKYWLDIEKELDKADKLATGDLNFAVYLTNISVGDFTNDIDKIFISQNNFANIEGVKSNENDVAYKLEWTDENGEQSEFVTKLEKFNSYKTLLSMVESAYNYAKCMKYQVNISGSISSATSTTAINADVAVQVQDLPDGTPNNTGIELFNGKELNVQADLDIKTNYAEKLDETAGTKQQTFDARHLIDLLYQSNGGGIYAAYAHSNFADDNKDKDGLNNNLPNVDANGNFVMDESGKYVGGNFFRAKVDNNHLSEIISMALAFADVNLGESLTNALSLPTNTTDFSFLREILSLDKQTDISGEISKADGLLSSVENITKMIKQINLKTEDLKSTLQIKLDLNANDPKLAGNIGIIDIVFIGTCKEDKITYNLSEIIIQNLVMGDSAFNFTISIGSFNKDTAFNYFTKHPEKDENGNITHIDFSEVSSFVDVIVNSLNAKGILLNGDTTISITSAIKIDVGFEIFVGLDENKELYVRAEVCVKDNVWNITSSDSLTPKPTYSTYILAGGKFDKRISVLEYKSKELVITQTTYNVQTTAGGSKHNEVRGGKGTSDNWVYASDEIGDNVMIIMAQALGLSNYAYDLIKFAISKIEAFPSVERALLDFGYDNQTSTYALKINAENLMGMNGIDDLTISIGVSKDYNTTYKGQPKTVKFIESVSTKLVIGGESLINIPLTLTSVNTESDYTTMDGLNIKSSEYFRQKYASHQDFCVVNLYHNGEFVKLMYCDVGQQISAADFADCKLLSQHGIKLYEMKDDSEVTSLTIAGNVNLYFKNYYAVTFDTNKASLMQNGQQVNDKTYLFLEGEIDLSSFTTTDYASSKWSWGTKYYRHYFQNWNGADENGHFNLTTDVTISANFAQTDSNKDEYNSLPH